MVLTTIGMAVATDLSVKLPKIQLAVVDYQP